MSLRFRCLQTARADKEDNKKERDEQKGENY